MSLPSASILGVGSYAPSRVLTNTDLEKMVDTTDEWILSRTGIRERRMAAEGEHTSDLALHAARAALNRAGVTPQELDLILVATCTPDMIFPSAACFLQAKLEAVHAGAVDMNAACCGFLYALSAGSQFVRAGSCKKVLVVGAEKLSTIVDWQDRNTCVLFGDAAGAVVLGAGDNPAEGVRSFFLGADGRHSEILRLPGGGSCHPASAETLEKRMHYLQMSGKEVFKLAVTAMQRAAQKALDQAGMTPADIACVIPHQANMRIVSALGDKLGLPEDKIFVNLDRYGNTSAASIPVALDEAVQMGRVKKGDNILMVAFGGGLTWAGSVITL